MTGFLVVFSFLGMFLFGWWSLLGGIILIVALAKWTIGKADAAKRLSCATAGPPARFIKWEGSVQIFDIPSESYATAFLKENASKAVNLSVEARTALSKR